jgi:dipeptidyl aminopeptidase/acylaminoacyl peptidase
MRIRIAFVFCALSVALITSAPRAGAQSDRLQPSDYMKLRAAGQVKFSPDGKLLAYTVIRFDRPPDKPGRAWSQVYVMDLATKKSIRFGGENDPSGDPVWSPDGRWLSYSGTAEGKHGLVIAHPDGTGATFLSEVNGTNAPLPGQGADVTWSPDSKQIAFISSTPGPETTDASGDPMVITRYMYRPDAGEGFTHFNDNRRLHIFIVDIASKRVRQLTDGEYYEHSIDWSPDGSEILFISDRSPNADQFFNYDIFAVKPADGSIRRITATENAEYSPRWSSDGKMIAFLATKRGLTDRETTMEDTHVWVMNSDGSGRHELSKLDARQGAPQWFPGSHYVFYVAQERGNTALYRHWVDADVNGSMSEPEFVTPGPGSVGAFSLAAPGSLAYSFATANDLGELYFMSHIATGRDAYARLVHDGKVGTQLTDLNADVLTGKQVAPVESFHFWSNDNKFEVQAFLVKPLGMTAISRHPLIVNIHGGPHGQNGPAFNFKDQIYAARGWAVLHVNYRGSTGYGQAFADAVFGDQNGNEAQDVLYGVSAALRRYPWLDRERMGIEGVSYGGQLTMWLITQTRMFRAAIPIAGISNLISYNYMTYYNQYEQMEFGQLPHQGDFMNLLWERSALKHVAAAATPTMLMHGENDPDVPIAEAEQYYIALKDVGVETIFVRYPREGHGIAESAHVVDSILRSIAWYEKHFPKTDPESPSAAVP